MKQQSRFSNPRVNRCPSVGNLEGMGGSWPTGSITGEVSLIALAVLCAACGGGPKRSDGVVRTDSAGVQIVDNVAPAWAPGQEWSVVGPDLTIGSAEGAEPTQFASIADVARLSDGTIVVADGASSELRYFRADGAFLGRAGRSGEGPGEFRLLNAIGRTRGDTVWAYDFALRRITLYPQWDATPIVHPLEQPLPTLGAAGRLADGSYVLAQYWGVDETDEVVTEGLRRDPAAIVRYDPDGRFIDTLGVFKAREVYLVTEDGRMVMGSPLFGRTLSRAAAGHAVFVGDQERWVVERYAPDGSLEMIVRLSDADLSIGVEELAAAKEARVAGVRPERRAAMRAYLDATEHPPTKPAYRRFIVDAAGYLWVGEYRVDMSPARRWQVFAPDGRWLGTVTVPEAFQPYDVGQDLMVGVTTDDLGVEYVQRYRIVKTYGP